MALDIGFSGIRFTLVLLHLFWVQELLAKGRDVDYARILSEIRSRDARDSGRATAPLKAADDAVRLDTSDLDREAAFAEAVAIVERVAGNSAAERASLRSK